MHHLGDPVDGRPSRRERTVRRPEGGVGSIDANLGTRATRTGRQAGREGQATGDLPLPPPSSALAGGVTVLAGDARELVGVDPSGHAVRWRLDHDPHALVCGIVGRPLRAEEWAASAVGSLGPDRVPAQCPG